MKNKALIITNIIILSCVAIGLLIFMILGLNDKIIFSSNSKLIGSIKYDNLENVFVDIKSYDLELISSDNNEVVVEVYGNEKNKNDITINNSNNNLNITQKKISYCFGFCANTRVLVKIPSTYVGDFTLKTISGDISSNIPFKGENKITSTSGDIDLSEINVGDIKSTSGEITINSLQKGNVKTTSGDIIIAKYGNGEINSTSGEVDITSLNGYAIIRTTSGDIEIENFQILGNTSITSTSGEIDIRLLNDANIISKSTSGDKDIKSSMGEYELNLKTTSGDITVR